MLYRIRVRGHISARIARLFPGFDAHPHDAVTDLVGSAEDQPALFAVLDRAQDLGLEIVEIVPCAE